MGRCALLVLAAVVMAGLLAPATASSSPNAGVVITTLSTRADLVSGGAVLVEVSGADPATLGRWQVTLDGQPVKDVFAVRADGRVTGLITGLREGVNRLTVITPDDGGATLELVDHPRSGPLFSGPQVPWVCPEGTEPGTCVRPTTFELVYVSDDPVASETCDAVPSTVTNRTPEAVDDVLTQMVEPCFQPYDPADPPTDVATTTTTEGVEVPYIVRLETGMMNRDEYRVAVLFDPARPWDPFDPQPGWNRRLVIRHGSSCGADFATGEAPDVLDEGRALGRGFAVLSTALSDSGHSCHVGLQAESLVMAKEHVVETYGEVRHTIGKGGSGGALAQQWVANAYPGIYDGLLVSQSFPDGWSTVQEIEDCNLLIGYWTDPTRWDPGVTWTPQQMAAVSGHASPSVCHSWVTVYGYPDVFDPTVGRSCDLPGDQRYHPTDRPHGVRCSLQDFTIGILGPREADGFAHRPYDNTGVQYGLGALQAGLITPAMFADLNASIGGRDIDGVWQPERARAEELGVQRAYRSGLVNIGNNMGAVAIIDLRGTNSAELHHHVRTHTMRARLDRSNGHHDNHLSWWGPIVTSGDTTFSSGAFDLMEKWLSAIDADTTDRPVEEKVLANRPEGAEDRCTDGRGGAAPQAACEAVADGTPRMVAGFGLVDDVIACQQRPLDRTDEYGPLPLTDADWAAMQAAFPGGVCDTTLPGRGQAPTVPWLSYADGPGGQPLGPPPTSVPVTAS